MVTEVLTGYEVCSLLSEILAPSIVCDFHCVYFQYSVFYGQKPHFRHSDTTGFLWELLWSLMVHEDSDTSAVVLSSEHLCCIFRPCHSATCWVLYASHAHSEADVVFAPNASWWLHMWWSSLWIWSFQRVTWDSSTFCCRGCSKCFFSLQYVVWIEIPL